MLVRFESGAVGSIEASRVAHGRKMDVGFELTLERGTLSFRGERANELLLYSSSDPAATQGFRTVHINGCHPDYAAFLPAPAHGLGFNDLKTIELHSFLKAIAEGRSMSPDFGEAAEVARICDAVVRSSQTGRAIDDPERGATR